MSSKSPRLRVLLLAGLGAVGSAQANVYLGASATTSTYDYGNIDSPVGGKAFGGVRLDNGLMLETQYQSFGSADIVGQPYSLRHDGGAAFIGYHSQTDRVGFLGKVGLHHTNARLRTRGVSGEETDASTGLALGVGLSYALNRHVAVRGEVEGFLNVKDFSGEDPSNLWTGGLGLEARF